MHFFTNNIKHSAVEGAGKRKTRKSVQKLRKCLKKTLVTSVDNQPPVEAIDDVDIDAVYAALCGAEFDLFLLSDLGGGKKHRDSVRILRNTARFLLWTHKADKNTPLDVSNVLSWLEVVIMEKYKLLFSYSVYCCSVLDFCPSTVRNHTCDIVIACEWYLIYGDNSLSLPVEGLVRIRHVAKNVRKGQTRREKHTRARTTIATKVEMRRMPADGLPELQRAVQAKLSWALSLRENDIDKEAFKMYMEILYSALYVFSAQGRISGVMDMNYGQAENLLAEGFSTTNKFKTNTRWQLQPVTLSETTHPLVQHYLQHVRPRVCKVDLPAQKDPLWLRFTGTPEEHVGLFVTAFFRRTIALHITTTAVRSLVETSMSEMHDEGRITNHRNLSVQAINGHTSKVVKEYYVHKERRNDVLRSRDAFAAYLESAEDSPDDPADVAASPPAPVVWRLPAKPTALDLGTDHPDYGTASKRARWTDEEVNYIGSWCKNKLHNNPECITLVAQCRMHILEDPAAHPIFHHIHLLDCGRLRSGYRLWVKGGSK
jgi:hypothetical protein